MTDYLTETAYLRWYRQYQVNLQLCLELLNHLRIRLDALPLVEEIGDIENRVNDLDENLEKAVPRNFSSYGEPLTSSEKIIENSKVLINLILRMTGKKDKYSGIYQEEKDKILRLHHEYLFKNKLREIRERIEAIEAAEYEELHQEAPLSEKGTNEASAAGQSG